ncbi:MAG TPA: hypothetical protein VF980_03915 [Thermoanaerobaculia bacterium]
MKSVERVVRVLESSGAPYALIGGHAVGARGFPRMTVDVDFLTTDRRVLRREFWKSLEDEGAAVDPRTGDFDDPLAGVVHIRLVAGDEVDIVVAKWKWEAAVISRAEHLDVGGLHVPVPRTSDLILLKLSAGGVLDLQDVAVLLAVGDRQQLVREVEENIASLGAEAVEAWRRISNQV